MTCFTHGPNLVNLSRTAIKFADPNDHLAHGIDYNPAINNQRTCVRKKAPRDLTGERLFYGTYTYVSCDIFWVKCGASNWNFCDL